MFAYTSSARTSWAIVIALCAVWAGCHRQRRAGQTPGSPLPDLALAAQAAPPIAAPMPGPVSLPVVTPETHPLAIVLASRLHVRQDPRVVVGNVLGTLRCGDIVALEAKAGEWHKIKLKSAGGYVYGAFVEPLQIGSRPPVCEFSFDRRLRKPETAVLSATQRPVRQLAPSRRAASNAAPTAESSAPTTPAAMPPASPPAPAPPLPAVASASASPGPPAASLPATPPAHASRTLPQQLTLSKPEHSSAAPVPFPHHTHADQYPCFRCHHPVTGSGNAAQKSATSDVANIEKNCHRCHRSAREQSPSAVRATAKDVFHQTCRDCHRVAGSGPTGCPQCHNR